MFDIFCLESAQLPHHAARTVQNTQQAMSLSRTRFFWLVTGPMDLSHWDWTWEPPPWEHHYSHAWPSQWQPDAGLYLIPRLGPQQIKYHTSPVITRLADHGPWYVPANIDSDSFDFSWHPNNQEPDFQYCFGTQWQDTGGPQYQGTQGIKLISQPRALAIPTSEKWQVPNNIDHDSFDFSWHPDIRDPDMTYMFGTQWQRTGGPCYGNGVHRKILEHPRAKALPQKQYWVIPTWIDQTQWDYSWHPDVLEPPCVYHFATQRGWNRIGGPEYHVPGATGHKYLDDPVAATQGDTSCWWIPDWIDPDSIDPSWCPDPSSPPYIYEFPVEWGWNHVGGPQYRVPGAKDIKYQDDFVARTQADTQAFEVLDIVDVSGSVFRWRPNPTDPPFVYVFGNQWWSAEKKASARFAVPGAQQIKYMSEPRCQRLPVAEKFEVLIPGALFDFSWEPDPDDPPYHYVFGNQWWPAQTQPTVRYSMPGARDIKYMSQPHALLTDTQEQRWRVLHDAEWDRTWQPDPGDPPYIYVLGNQWHAAEIMPTVEYHVPGATTRKFLNDVKAKLPQNRRGWYVPTEINSEAIDYSWCPDPGSPPFVYHFGSAQHSSIGVTYTVDGATEVKFAGDVPALDVNQSVRLDLDVFYLDHSNALSPTRFQQLQRRMPRLQKVRVANDLMQTLRRCSQRSATSSFWVLSSHNDYSDFDFEWHPESWQRGMIHVFGTQWSKWSDTFYINRWEFERQQSWNNDIKNFYNLNFVENQRVTAATDALDVILIDHGNSQYQICHDTLASRSGRVVRTARYFNNYLDTLRRCIDDSVTGSHVWVCSSVCDYSRFDFSWQPEIWQRDMIHVFASHDNKFGDTFLIPVKHWQHQQGNLTMLEWFDTVNYVMDPCVPRWPVPVHRHDNDSHMQDLANITAQGPLVLITTKPSDPQYLPTVSLWHDKTKVITPLDPAAETVIVPREALSRINTQFYDYPWIDLDHQNLDASQAQDIIFISYDEPQAQENWQRLHDRFPRAHRVHGVQGMEHALRAAADTSTTPWFYAVFAKTQLAPDWNFDFLPDRMQIPKHYIFHCHNLVNDLVYGHMGMVLYNRRMVLTAPGYQDLGLDYTMSFAHDVVPMVSCVARFDSTAYHTWRTAFRESTKLAYFESQAVSIEGAYRLGVWQTRAQGPYAQWCLQGARDGVEFFHSTGGDLNQIKQSFDWQWLRQYFVAQHGDLD